MIFDNIDHWKKRIDEASKMPFKTKRGVAKDRKSKKRTQRESRVVAGEGSAIDCAHRQMLSSGPLLRPVLSLCKSVLVYIAVDERSTRYMNLVMQVNVSQKRTEQTTISVLAIRESS